MTAAVTLHSEINLPRAALLAKVAEHQAHGINPADLTRELPLTQSAVITNLRWLEGAGMLRKPRQATGQKLCTLTPDGLAQHRIAAQVHEVLLGHLVLRGVLVTVDACPGFNALEIGRRLKTVSSTASAHLARLAEAGLVDRRRREGLLLNYLTAAGDAQVPFLPPREAGAR